jgi:glucosamine kinase
MPKDIFIGVDGGGTKTKMVVEDAQGNILGEGLGGPAQIRVSVDQAWSSINQTLNEILLPINIHLDDPNYRFHAGFGLAGTEFKKPYYNFTSRPHSFATLCLKSDGYAACLGAHDGKDGAIIIIGTGVKGLQVENGHVSEVSGWGFPQGDEGSGAWLGLQAIRLTLHSLDGRLPPSPLFEAILSKFSHNLSDLLNWTIDATSTQYATIAPIVVEYVDKKDPFALKIMKEAAESIDEVGKALARCIQDKAKPMPYCLFGGIAPFIEPFLSEELRTRIVERKYGAAKGAIYMVKEYICSQQEKH